jgi:site-specific recombinase XerD
MGEGDEKTQAALVATLLETARSQAEQIKLLMALHTAGAIAAAAAPAPAPAPHASLTWDELWIHYSESECDKLASWKTVEGRAKHVRRILGPLRVAESSVHTVRHYRQVRKTETTIRKSLATPTTINREVELIVRMPRWASRQKPPLLQVNPFAGYERGDLFEAIENVRLNVIEDNRGGPLTLDDLLADASLLERALVLVAHSSGMRRRELALMQREWIDRRPGDDGKPLRIVRIPVGISKGRKGKRLGRDTIISEEALQAIDDYWETLPFPHRYRNLYVFVSPKTWTHYEPSHFTVVFRNLAERRGMVGPSGKLWLHDCRRSFITLPRRRGEDTRNIMAMSGHKTASAFERYDIHSNIDAIVVRDRIEDAREKERLALEVQRRGPQRAPEKNLAVEKQRNRK